ncbi:MAG: hypothetical protein GX605_06980, partial [Chloroflexi bacterium]|nr:hypothetical protein [Chloroflexota bacterium]
MTRLIACPTFAAALLAPAACTTTPAGFTVTPPHSPQQGKGDAEAEALAAKARADLAARLGLAQKAITLESLEPWTFADSSLGVPQPDTLYADVLTPGYIIRLSAGGATYCYHGAGDRVVAAPADLDLGSPGECDA